MASRETLLIFKWLIFIITSSGINPQKIQEIQAKKSKIND